MKHIITIVVFIFTSVNVVAENIGYNNYYPYIIEVNNGPIKYHKDQSNPYDLGVMYRAVIIFEEIYYTLRVEKFQVGDEGSLSYHSTKIVNIGSPLKINSIKWINSDSFEVLLNKKIKIIKLDNSGKWNIE